ncbi:peptide chain release factor 1 [Nitrosopumilus sp. K4]|uniref:baeRF10 domain-containing protein n=1 Tax=Nitrosopumilus sp. K4 TaxID=2795383 RepID=UPI001BA481EF|nr:Vms1/Ankzf1 family peptidyl-tRNA hydrolase [Nitrosopumilus sp. K4]QUC65521.1 peptide chain release factor 1 [Nitrosopumilus sp. K4]
MKSHLETSEISPDEWLSINQFLFEIKQIEKPCVSVYYPYGKGTETISLLKNTKREESIERIEKEIEKRISRLKKHPTTVGKTTKTLCIFGWIQNGKVTIKEIGTSKKLPYIYTVSKKPHIKPFFDILKTNHDVIFVILDQKSAKIQKFHGGQSIEEAKLGIDLRGRHKKGGQSQGRFLRARNTKIHVFFKKIAAKIRMMSQDVNLILIGGNGNAKTEFFDELDTESKKKCRFVTNVSFSTPKSKVYEKIIHHLYKQRRQHVSDVISRYEKLVKEGLTAKKNSVIYKALELGAVETLIVSADYHTSTQFRKIMKMLEIAKNTAAKIEFATSPKIIEKLDINDSVLAILRYRIK